jgi:cell wall-associated NlpC family hydrolase
MQKRLGISLGMAISLFVSGCTPMQTHSNYGNYTNQQNYSDPRRTNIVRTAHQMLGTRYKWGGESPREGFDCSGLTLYTLAKAGIRIPRRAAQQRDASRRVSYTQLQPGDLIFFKTGKTSDHVGIYIGNGEFIQAGSGSGRVKKEHLDNPYWKKRWVKFGTFLT